MQYPDVKNSKEEEDHWIGLSDFERERFERHADFLIDQGYMAVDPHTLAVKVASTADLREKLERHRGGRQPVSRQGS
jgi:hypothetical protein